MHICDTPGCYFIGHLVVGADNRINTADAAAKGRMRNGRGGAGDAPSAA
jgi:hypothetical protein